MKTTILIGLFVNMLMISVADHSTRHARHSYLHNRHERRERHQQPTNYRYYEPSYQNYPGYNREKELTTEIIHLLREIQDNISKQKQRHSYQPIYIPYPVLSIPPYNVKQPITNKPIPALPSRNNFADDEKEYMRPIMLKPVTEAPSTTTTMKISDSESAIVFRSEEESRKPLTCDVAILLCCRFKEADETKTCFSQYGCNKIYGTKLACQNRAIQNVIQSFIDTFGPK